MSFRLKQHESIPRGVARIATHRLNKAIDALGESAVPSDAEIHKARKQFRITRAMLRLVRAELGKRRFERENTALRDFARQLSAVRDAKALIDRFEALSDLFEMHIGPEAVVKLRRLLAARAEGRACTFAVDKTAARLVEGSRAARKRVKTWPLRRSGWKSIKGGLRRTYKRGRDAMEDVLLCGAVDEALHDWRKRTKDLRYELELLRDVCAPDPRLADRSRRLTDVLGEDHDLAILRSVAATTFQGDARSYATAMTGLIDCRRRSLQRRAMNLGKEIYGRNPSAFVRELERNWEMSHAEGSSSTHARRRLLSGLRRTAQPQ